MKGFKFRDYIPIVILGVILAAAPAIAFSEEEKESKEVSTPATLNCYNPVDKETGRILEYTCAYLIIIDGKPTIVEQKMGHM